MNYISIKFHRGQGLCNRLFPFARGVIFARLNNYKVLKPKFAHFRKAPFLMGGIDYKKSIRKILLWDTFIFSYPFYVSGLYKKIILFKYKKVTQPDNILKLYHGDNKIIEFSLQHEFTGLYQFRNEINNEIRNVTKKKWLKFIKNYPPFQIGINIRLGNDFKNAENKDDFINKGLIKTPLYWFIETLKYVREIKGYDVDAFVISDGTKEQLKDILILPNVHFVETPSPMTDLLLLSNSRLLLGSGGSSFSAWASFLGKMPTLTITGQNLNWFKVSQSDIDHFVGTFDPDDKNENIVLNKIIENINF